MSRLAYFLLICLLFLQSCNPSPSGLQTVAAGTLVASTQAPTQAPYPTSTPNPTLTTNPTYTPYPTFTEQPVVTQVVVQTPTPDLSNINCTPLTNMDYTDDTKAFVLLQTYVSSLPDVRQLSYIVPEKIYSDTLSNIVLVRYIAKSNAQYYSKKYIIYMDEFGWSTGVFSIDGQCWIDGPH
jgi:hypothetical protein